MKLRETNRGINDLYLLTRKIEEKKTKSGDSYLAFEFTDGDIVISANQWSMSQSETLASVGAVSFVRLEVGTYNGQPNYVVKQLRPVTDADRVNLADFIKTAPIASEKMFNCIMTHINTVNDPGMSQLTKTILQDNKEKLLKWPAAKMVHHNLRGGLLYHMLRMVEMADKIAAIYPIANRDLLICGSALHDIGKLNELDTSELGDAEYTVDGMLFGHLLIGADMIRDYGKLLGTNQETIRELRHIIISHHGVPDMGAIKRPSFLEAYLIHEIDMIDSRVYQYEQIAKDTEPGTFTENKIFGLGNARVYVSE